MSEKEILRLFIIENYEKKIEHRDVKTKTTIYTEYRIEKPAGEGNFYISYTEDQQSQHGNKFVLTYENGYDDDDGNSTWETYWLNSNEEFTFKQFEKNFRDGLCESYGVETFTELKDEYYDEVGETLEFIEDFKSQYKKFKLKIDLSENLSNKKTSKKSIKI